MTKELIEELRAYATALRASVHVPHTGADLIERGADALVARQPSVIDRDTAIDAIAGGTISVPGGYGVLHGDDAANIVDAIIGQAAVPDAATDVREYLHAKCDCVPDLGPAHCHLCSADGSPVEWANCVAVQQVTDAPETVEVAFKTVEVERLGHLLVQLSPATPRNGAATVRRLMEEMNIKEVVS